MELLGQTVVNAIMTTCFYMLIAVGFSLVFGVMGVANYAHGEFFMLGAYALWFLYGELHLPFILSVLAALIIVGLVGIITERFLFKWVRGNVLGGVLIGIGLIFILQVLVGRIWGVGLPKPVPAAFPGTLDILSTSISWQRFIIIPATGFVLAVLFLFLHKTQIGRSLRACAMDSEAAALQGVSINKSSAIALGAGAALAGFGGALLAPIISVHPYMGHVPLLFCFIVVIVGGAGNLKGSILASILFGFLHTFLTTYLDSTIAMIASCLLMYIILAIKPQGLLGYAEK